MTEGPAGLAGPSVFTSSRARSPRSCSISAVWVAAIVAASATASGFCPLAFSSSAMLIAPSWWAIMSSAKALSKAFPVAAPRFVMSSSDIIPGMEPCPAGASTGCPHAVSQPVRVAISGSWAPLMAAASSLSSGSSARVSASVAISTA